MHEQQHRFTEFGCSEVRQRFGGSEVQRFRGSEVQRLRRTQGDLHADPAFGGLVFWDPS